ncbi:Palmitoyl-protein thioesterase 1 [Ascosphaera aggregata]|nr:Palmitoyl-protein thioesterase 1 [Ascosphaera aggregata]
MKSLLTYLPLLFALAAAAPAPQSPAQNPAPAPAPPSAPVLSSSPRILLPSRQTGTANNHHNVAGNKDDDDNIAALPLIIWHGLGDSYGNAGIKEIAALAGDVTPGTYVHVIRLGDTPNADREATFVGNVTAQVDSVCEQLQMDRILSTAPAINALGFSQGGQFLRALIERCADGGETGRGGIPPVHNLVTFGSQHNGIHAFQQCQSFFDVVCKSAEALLRRGRWSYFAQSRFVPAQYFRDPEELDNYLQYSTFLADINNERAIKNEGYKKNMQRLNHFAMMMFANDTVVVPKESAFFADVYKTAQKVVPLRQRDIYKQDWIGLKTLDEAGKLSFEVVEGDHMQLTEETLRDIFTKYFAPVDLSTLNTPREGDGSRVPGLISQSAVIAS